MKIKCETSTVIKRWYNVLYVCIGEVGSMNSKCNEYIVFLMDNGIGYDSAKSYVSYVKNACKKFLDFKIKNSFDYILDSTKDEMSKAVEMLNTLLSEEIKNPKSTYNKKTLQNYHSGVVRFISFIEQLSDYGNNTGLFYVEYPISSTYYNKDIVHIFKSRLNTQDRFYSSTSLPCRIINKILSKDKRYKDILMKLILKTKFILEDKTIICLKDIKEITIYTNYVIMLDKKDKAHKILTEVYVNQKLTGYELMKVEAFSSLSLDHDVSLKTLLVNDDVLYPELSKLARDVLDYKKKANLTGSKLAKDYVDNKYLSLGINKDKLIKF